MPITVKKCGACESWIPDDAKKCRYCLQWVPYKVLGRLPITRRWAAGQLVWIGLTAVSVVIAALAYHTATQASHAQVSVGSAEWAASRQISDPVTHELQYQCDINLRFDNTGGTDGEIVGYVVIFSHPDTYGQQEQVLHSPREITLWNTLESPAPGSLDYFRVIADLTQQPLETGGGTSAHPTSQFLTPNPAPLSITVKAHSAESRQFRFAFQGTPFTLPQPKTVPGADHISVTLTPVLTSHERTTGSLPVDCFDVPSMPPTTGYGGPH
jgi:hypothetical protein